MAHGVDVLSKPLFSIIQGQTSHAGAHVCPGQGVGPVAFGRCLWNFLQRGSWRERQHGGETVSAQRLTPCLPGLHCPCWLSAAVTGRKGPLPQDPPAAAGFGGCLQPLFPVSGEHRVPCRGAAMGSCGTRCLIRSLLCSRAPCLPWEGPACHYGLSYKAAAQQKMIRFPAAFSVPGPAGRADLPRGRSWAEP